MLLASRAPTRVPRSAENRSPAAIYGTATVKKVPPTGIEPVTPGLGILCSIQLSYEGFGSDLVCSRRGRQAPGPGHVRGLSCDANELA